MKQGAVNREKGGEGEVEGKRRGGKEGDASQGRGELDGQTATFHPPDARMLEPQWSRRKPRRNCLYVPTLTTMTAGSMPSPKRSVRHLKPRWFKRREIGCKTEGNHGAYTGDGSYQWLGQE